MRIPSNVLFLLASIFILPAIPGADEPFLGVWKLNVERSLPPAVMKSQVIELTAEDGMFVMAENNVTLNGIEYGVTCKLALDGKDYPMTGSHAGIELVSGRRLGPNTVELKAKKKDGSVVATYWMGLAADGKTRITLTWLGAEMSGPPVRASIHERQ